MIKFTEIFNLPTSYDPDLKRAPDSFSVREVYINPSYIISAKENAVLYAKAQKAPLIEGLKREARFTEVLLGTPGHAPPRLSLVTAPEHFAQKIVRGSK